MQKVVNDSGRVDCDQTRLDSIFDDLNQCCLPGAAVGIAINGRPIYRKGFGLASMELPIMLSPSIRMRIYSVTKQFTCFSYMLLCEAGAAGLDDHIGRFLPELNPACRKVTMRQLMGNIGGLRDAHDFVWQFGGFDRPLSSSDFLSLYSDFDDVNFRPGSSWLYSNGGFLLVAAAIERISGESLERVFQTRVFEPIGMYNTQLRRWNTDFVDNCATMHMVNSAGVFEKSYLGAASAGEGGIISTVDDMLRWLSHMAKPTVGSAETWAAMKAPQYLSNGTSTGYGLGLVQGSYRGVGILFHSGGGMGANAQMLKVPSVGLDIVILVNRHDVMGATLADRVLDAMLPDLEEIKDGAKGPPISGVYKSADSGRIASMSVRGGSQFISLDGGEMPLAYDDQGKLLPTGTTLYKRSFYLKGDPSAPHSIEMTEFGNAEVFSLVPSGPNSSAEKICGRFRSEQPGIEVVITVGASGLQLITFSRFGSVTYALAHLAQDVWSSKSLSPPYFGGILSFSEDSDDFRYSTVSNRAIAFRRCA